MRLTATPKKRPARGPAPAALEITKSEDDPGFILLRLDSEGLEVGDTWHLTLDEAQGQAEFEFGVEPESWVREHD